VVSFIPRPLYPRGKSPWYPLDRRLGGTQNRYGQYGEEKILDPTGTQTEPQNLSQLRITKHTKNKLVLKCIEKKLIFTKVMKV
jgi:hypothetical protein